MSFDGKLILIQFFIKAKTRTNNGIVQALHKNSHWRLETFSAACTDIFFSRLTLVVDCFCYVKVLCRFLFLYAKNCSRWSKSKSKGRHSTKKVLQALEKVACSVKSFPR